MRVDNVEISRSHKRKRTVQGRMVNGVLRINAPAGISEQQLQRIIENFKQRFASRTLARQLNQERSLDEQAQELNRRYFAGALRWTRIEYSAEQSRLYGSCSWKSGRIRISHRLSRVPDWVRAYVIVHELAHLREPNHGPRFHALVNRYALAERARGFLMALGFAEESPSSGAQEAESGENKSYAATQK